MTLRENARPARPGREDSSKIYREIAVGKPNRLDSQIGHL
jgi:hypothetical protein